MIYATYEYYTDQYYGTRLTEKEFPRYAKRASAEIDHVTFGRLSNMPDDTIPDAVRDAMCDVADHLHLYATTADGGVIASESNDGYSVSYRDTGSSAFQKREILATIRTYLAVTGLMFRGASQSYDMC